MKETPRSCANNFGADEYTDRELDEDVVRYKPRPNPETGRPEYRDQGDACLNWCSCTHERRHRTDLETPDIWRTLILPFEQGRNWLECRGYAAGVECLERLR